MIARLKRFIFGDKREIRKSVPSQILGELIFSEDEESWISGVAANAEGIKFNIAGDWRDDVVVIEPAKVLVARAEEMARNISSIRQDVDAFLRAEIERNPSLSEWRNEILALRISAICLFWPERPLDGEILFATPNGSGGRIWACAYQNGKPAPTLSFSG